MTAQYEYSNDRNRGSIAKLSFSLRSEISDQDGCIAECRLHNDAVLLYLDDCLQRGAFWQELDFPQSALELPCHDSKASSSGHNPIA